MVTYRNIEGECQTLQQPGQSGRDFPIGMQRIHRCPGEVAGPAPYGNSERLGRNRDGEAFSNGRPGGRPTGYPDEDMDPGTGEIDEAPQADAGPAQPSVVQGATVTPSGSGTDPDAGETLT